MLEMCKTDSDNDASKSYFLIEAACQNERTLSCDPEPSVSAHLFKVPLSLSAVMNEVSVTVKSVGTLLAFMFCFFFSDLVDLTCMCVHVYVFLPLDVLAES